MLRPICLKMDGPATSNQLSLNPFSIDAILTKRSENSAVAAASLPDNNSVCSGTHSLYETYNNNNPHHQHHQQQYHEQQQKQHQLFLTQAAFLERARNHMYLSAGKHDMYGLQRQLGGGQQWLSVPAAWYSAPRHPSSSSRSHHLMSQHDQSHDDDDEDHGDDDDELADDEDADDDAEGKESGALSDKDAGECAEESGGEEVDIESISTTSPAPPDEDEDEEGEGQERAVSEHGGGQEEATTQRRSSAHGERSHPDTPKLT